MFRVIDKDGKTMFTGSREDCRDWAYNENRISRKFLIVRSI